ncbi:MAG: nicotinamide-nucleotide amidohydrolase family protein [Ornithinimicrobium sp.]
MRSSSPARERESSASLAVAIIDLSRDQGWTIGTAESLTGGLLASALVSVPGASHVVRGGIVAYAADLKRTVLGVGDEVISAYGTVSQQCAEAMGAGACRVLTADFGVATTGVAGPDASEGHPPGTIHLAVAGGPKDREEVTVHEALHMRGSRSQIRAEATRAGLSLLLNTLQKHGPNARAIRGGVR